MKSASSTYPCVALLCALGSLFGAPARAADPPDALITVKGKIALMTAPDVSPTAVHLDTINGVAILYGKVRTPAEKVNAKRIVAGISGVRNVRDLLQVVPINDEGRVQRHDAEIKEAAERVLKNDRSLAESEISVKTVDRGVVLLQGNAATLFAYLTAVKDVTEVPGVRRVSSEVRSSEMLGEPQRELLKRVDASGPLAEPQGSAVQDAWIAMAAKMRFLADPQVPAMDVGLEVNGGAVTLFGVVTSERAKQAAEGDALAIDAVQSVHNELQVVPKAQKEVVRLQDAALQRTVELALKGHRELADVHVSVNNGVAHLSGRVATAWERLRAATVARAVPGVDAVNDDLRLERGGASR